MTPIDFFGMGMTCISIIVLIGIIHEDWKRAKKEWEFRRIDIHTEEVK